MTPAIAENTVNQIDALDLLRALPDASVDCVLTDPPYGTTACAWDTPIDLVAWWVAVRRVVKPNAAIVMTASQPFTSALIASNYALFKYCWYWQKERATGFNYARFQPMRLIEDVCVFGMGAVNYYPVMTKLAAPYTHLLPINKSASANMTSPGRYEDGRRVDKEYTHSFPKHLLVYAREFDTTHPTQKPVALFEYLIRTYTRPGDLVVDPFGGSGTTAVAARNLGRRYITGDTDAGYCAIMRRRLSEPYTPQMFAEEADAVDDAPRQVEMFAQGADNAK